MAKIEYLIGYKNKYIGIDGISAADGYHYVTSPSAAVRFPTQVDCATFMDLTGPAWLVDMCKKGMIRMITIEDGVPVKS